jgi:predicted PurR-regulated permease PerM
MATWDRKYIFKVGLSTLFLGAFTLLFLPFYAEIFLAAIFAFAMEPKLGRLLHLRSLRWRTSVALILVGMFFVIATPIVIVAYKAYASLVEISKTGFQNTEIFQKLVVIKTELLKLITRVSNRLNLNEQFDMGSLSEDSLSTVANGALSVMTSLVTNIPSLLLSVFVFCAALYFFLAEAAVIKHIFYRQQVLNPHEADRLIDVMQRASFSTVVTSVIIGVIQGSIVALGSLIFDVGDFMVVFVVTFFCSFIPVIGAGPVALSLGLYKLLLGDYGQAIGLIVVSVIAGTTDNIVRPYLISSSEGDLHPIVSLLAIIGALVVFGMPGLLLGPVIASVAIKIIPTLYSPAMIQAKDLGKRSP